MKRLIRKILREEIEKILMVILMIEDEIEEIERIEIESGKRIEKNYEIRNNFLI